MEAGKKVNRQGFLKFSSRVGKSRSREIGKWRASSNSDDSYLLAVVEDLDLVGPAGGLVVEVGGPLAGGRHVLVVEQPAQLVPGLLRADHGHHGVVVLGARGLEKMRQVKCWS